MERMSRRLERHKSKIFEEQSPSKGDSLKFIVNFTDIMEDHSNNQKQLNPNELASKKYKIIENYIPFSEKQLQELFVKYFPENKTRASDFSYIIKGDKLMSFLLSAENIQKFLALKLKQADNYGQKGSRLVIRDIEVL